MTGQCEPHFSQAVSFVIRLWLEPEHEGTPQWRGHILHVQGEEEAYFHNFATMVEFLERVSHTSVSLRARELD